MPELKNLKTSDPDVYDIIIGESNRQKEGMELIAAENYVSEAVLESMGTIFNNKYAEGYPGRRYYGGQKYTDEVEELARTRACELFKCEHANVQPHSGANANVAMYFSLLEPGDTVLGMDLSHGGHLTHGHPVTYITKIFNFVRYKMKDIETGEIDYDEMREVAKKEKPKIILCGFSAYPREINYKKVREIADEVGAYAIMDMAHIAGLIAGEALDNPFDFGFDVVTTTTHKSLRGPRGGMILSKKELAAKIDKTIFPGFQGGPIMQIIAAKAVALQEALKPEFKTYAQQVINNAKAMAEVFSKENCRMITGGTDNHLILLDAVTSFNVSGQEAETALDSVDITLNKNMIANDPRKALDPSGIRIGTPAMTTRGIKEEDAKQIAKWIIDVCRNHQDQGRLDQIKSEVNEFCLKLPLPGENS